MRHTIRRAPWRCPTRRSALSSPSAGREARGDLGRAVAELADLCEGIVTSLRSARGQASLMMLAVVGLLLALTLVLFAFGNALGAKGRHQRAADLAAVSAAQVMRDLYPRLFEPPFLAPDVPNPRHLERGQLPRARPRRSGTGRAPERRADRALGRELSG